MLIFCKFQADFCYIQENISIIFHFKIIENLSKLLPHCRAVQKWPYEGDSAIIFKIQAIANDFIDVSYKIYGSKEFTSFYTFSITAEIQRVSRGDAENNMLSTELLSKIKQVKFILPGLQYENQPGQNNLEVFFEKLQRLTILEVVGFFDLSGVNEELLADLLDNLPNSPKLNTLYIENYQALYTGAKVTQFLQKLVYVRHVVLIDSRVDCVHENGGKMETMHIENSAKENVNGSDDAISSVISENANSLADLAVHTKSMVNFMSYIFWTLFHVDWLNLEKMFVQYLSSSSEPVMTYEMIEREQPDALAQIKLTMVATDVTMKNLSNVINMLINGDIDKDFCMQTNIIAHLIIIVNIELVRNELVILKNLVLNKHSKSQRLEIKTKNLPVLHQLWSNVGNEICEIDEFSIVVDDSAIITDSIVHEKVRSDLIFTLVVHTHHIYEIFSRREQHIRLFLWVRDIAIVTQYGGILSKQHMVKTLEIYGWSSCEILRIAIKQGEQGQKARSMPKLKKVTVNIQLEDKNTALTFFGLKNLQNIILILTTEKEAQEVKKWQIDDTEWNEGIIIPIIINASSPSYSVEFTTKRIETENEGNKNKANVEGMKTEGARIKSEEIRSGEPTTGEAEDEILAKTEKARNEGTKIVKKVPGILKSGKIKNIFGTPRNISFKKLSGDEMAINSRPNEVEVK